MHFVGVLIGGLSWNSMLFPTTSALICAIFFTVILLEDFKLKELTITSSLKILIKCLVSCALSLLLFSLLIAYVPVFRRGYLDLKFHSLLVSAIFTFVYSAFFSKYNRHDKYLMGFVFMYMQQSGHFVINGALSRLFFPELSWSFNDKLTFFIYPIFLLLILVILKKYVTRDKYEKPKFSWFPVSITLVITFTITLIFFSKCAYDNELYDIYITILVICQAANILSYYLTFAWTRSYTERLELTALSLKASDDFEAMERDKQLHENIRSMRHEMKNHLVLMQLLIAQKEYDKLDKYFEELCGTQYSVLTTVCSGNTVIDTLLNNAISTFNIDNIKLEIFINITRSLNISDTDLCSLISNLLSNARKAALRSKTPLVSISIKTENDFLFISVNNSINSSVLAVNPNLETTKDDNINHGFGIKTIKSVVNTYNGKVFFDENDGMFNVSIMLILPK